ncbi:MAG: trypsin-like serine protease, partial [Bacteroidota bacterium]
MKNTTQPLFGNTFALVLLLACTCLPVLLSSQTRFNGQLWYPKPAPNFEPAKKKSPLLVNRLVQFDPKTRSEKILDDSNNGIFDASHSPSNPGVLPVTGTSAALESLAKSFSPLEPVPNPTGEPARWNVKIFIKQGGNNWVCSGSLIDSRHVLTAGHCLFDGGWADSVFVVPAFHEDAQGNGIAPYGAATDVNLLSWTGWTQQHDYEWDMGVIFLERPVGALTGWFG